MNAVPPPHSLIIWCEVEICADGNEISLQLTPARRSDVTGCGQVLYGAYDQSSTYY